MLNYCDEQLPSWIHCVQIQERQAKQERLQKFNQHVQDLRSSLKQLPAAKVQRQATLAMPAPAPMKAACTPAFCRQQSVIACDRWQQDFVLLLHIGQHTSPVL